MSEPKPITIKPGTTMGPEAIAILIPYEKASGVRHWTRVGTLDPVTRIYQMGGLGRDKTPRWKRLVWFENTPRGTVTFVTFHPYSWVQISQQADWIELVRPELEDDKVFHVSMHEALSEGRELSTHMGDRFGVPWPWIAGRVGFPKPYRGTPLKAPVLRDHRNLPEPKPLSLPEGAEEVTLF